MRGEMDKEPDPAPWLPGAPLGYRPRAVFSGVAACGSAALDTSGVSLERLRYEEEQSYYNDLYLLAPVGYFVVAFDSTILQVNLVGAEMLGIERARPGKHRFRTFIAPSFLADFDGFISAALNCPEPRSCMVQMQRAGGDAFQVTLWASADGGGQACRVVLERAEGKLAALERSEERFRRIVHTAEEGIWEIDAVSCTTFVNPRMADMLGYTIEDMLGKPLAAFMDEEGKAVLEENIEMREDRAPRTANSNSCTRTATRSGPRWPPIRFSMRPYCYMGALALVTDITGNKENGQVAWQQANFDPLTRLPNRHMFMERLRHEIRKAERSDAFLALLFVDLDHFKEVNDRLGHARGDQVLVEAARRITSCVRGTDMVARLGGDEFTVILVGLDLVGSVERVARSMVQLMALPFDLNGEKLHLSASIGIALYPADATTLDTLVEHADQAMYASKKDGRSRFSYYTPSLQEAAQARQTIAADLRAAIAAQQFEILYQPIVSLQTGAVHKAEALLRWRHPTRGLLGPAEFIPFAESNGLIVEIGDWVFREERARCSTGRR
ncbi:diguanylate cyclase [Massilia sp. B-10]|nr:diguanylate cyclase [Massilia sp. B-10]